MSLEWLVPGTKNVDGWGVPHLCKNWVSLALFRRSPRYLHFVVLKNRGYGLTTNDMQDSVMDFRNVNHLNASKRTDIGGE